MQVKHLSLDMWRGSGVHGALVAEPATLESAVDSVDALLGKIMMDFLFFVICFGDTYFIST